MKTERNMSKIISIILGTSKNVAMSARGDIVERKTLLPTPLNNTNTSNRFHHNNHLLSHNNGTRRAYMRKPHQNRQPSDQQHSTNYNKDGPQSRQQYTTRSHLQTVSELALPENNQTEAHTKHQNQCANNEQQKTNFSSQDIRYNHSRQQASSNNHLSHQTANNSTDNTNSVMSYEPFPALLPSFFTTPPPLYYTHPHQRQTNNLTQLNQDQHQHNHQVEQSKVKTNTTLHASSPAQLP